VSKPDQILEFSTVYREEDSKKKSERGRCLNFIDLFNSVHMNHHNIQQSGGKSVGWLG